MSYQPLMAATFVCNQTGIWSNPAIWTITVGSDADGIPDVDDEVKITNFTVTLGSDVTCDKLELFSATLDANNYDIVVNTMTANILIPNANPSYVNKIKNLTVVTEISPNNLILNGFLRGNINFGYMLLGGNNTNSYGLTINNCTCKTGGILEISPTPNDIFIGAGSILRIVDPPPSYIAVNLGTTKILTDNVEPLGGFGILEIAINATCFGTSIQCPVVIDGSLELRNAVGNILGLPTNPEYKITGSGKIIVPPMGVLNSSVGLDDLVLNGASLENNSTLNSLPIKFKGTTPQTLSGTGIVNNVIVDNPNGVTIDGSPTINTLTLTNGGLILNNADVKVGSILGFGTTRYIKTLGTGSLVKSVNPGLNSNLFPVGTSTYAPIDLANTIPNSNNPIFNYAVNVRDGINPTRPLSGTAGTSFINKEWNISPTGGSTALNVYLYWQSGDVNAGFSCSTANMLHHNGSTWDVLPEANTLRGCFANIIGVSNVTNFSPFAIGQASTVLSADLISIKATPQYQAILINWQTANEQNMLDFGIERSVDGLSFETIGTVNAHNAPSIYDFKDASAQENTPYYYRIAQRENSGKTEYSKVVSATLSGKNKTISVFPNPATDVLNVSGMEPTDEWQVVDIIGKIRATYKGAQILDLTRFDSGFYFIKVGNKNSTRFVVNK